MGGGDSRWRGGKRKPLKLSAVRGADTGRFVGLVFSKVWEHAYYIDYRNSRPGYIGEACEDARARMRIVELSWCMRSRVFVGCTCVRRTHTRPLMGHTPSEVTDSAPTAHRLARYQSALSNFISSSSSAGSKD